MIFYKYSLLLAIFSLNINSAMAQGGTAQSRLEEKQPVSLVKYRQTKTQNSLENAQKELNNIRNEARILAKKVQQHEQRLDKIEEQLSNLNKERQQKQQAVNARSDEISALIAAMIRMSNAPKEAVLVMPDGLKGKVQASRALGLMTGSMQKDMDSLMLEMRHIQKLQNKIALERDKLNKLNAGLAQKQVELQQTISQRKQLIKSLSGESLQEKKQLAMLNKQANNLQSLVKGLESSRVTQFEQRFANIGTPIFRPKLSKLTKKPPVSMIKPIKKKVFNSASFIKAKGTLTAPAKGRVVGSFGKKKGKNDTLKGIEILTRKNAQVVSPYQGEVMFTGPFLDYGNMIIIRHSNQYHTLLAGFQSVNCEAGQFLLEGEPIGVMGSGKSLSNLYIELRKDGKAINPKPWIADYKSLLANRR